MFLHLWFILVRLVDGLKRGECEYFMLILLNHLPSLHGSQDSGSLLVDNCLKHALNLMIVDWLGCLLAGHGWRPLVEDRALLRPLE